MSYLQDKVIVIAGGAGLIGQALAKALMKAGAKVVIADSNIESAEAVSKRLSQLDCTGQCDFVELDITSASSVERTLDNLRQKYQVIDGVVNNAYPRNKNYGREFFGVEYQDFCENIGMNLGGVFLVSQKFAQFFIDQGWGNIVNISSIYGTIAPRFEVYNGTSMTMPVEYAAIKSGVTHLTKYLAKFLKGNNIRVNAISPGGVLDAQPDSFVQSYNSYCLNKGMLDKDDLGGTLVYLLSDLSCAVNGQNIIVDDGFTL